ncbi:enoyl-CoA hydratase/isomerase family protein [Rhizobium sp. BK251]|uniref:enoyl-CoA hydratase/isomerase family protein n=1 Tax=Rhizobium sp. BK251 TaxID=2512125 RepID=UPI0010468224|nr:enoyl-CoA hydratase/isomerase family protein [Rhizobium sp. BK251]TCL68294.1 enoyl-CoA hydratase/carnithine racemase [Rhizobium sp. BK251]
MTIKKDFQVTRHSPDFWHVTFDNPPLNLIGPATINDLNELAREMEADPELKVVLFDSANPEFFIAHFDMSRAGEAQPDMPGGRSVWIDFTERLSQSPAISIASVRGRARGVGNEMLLACDLRFASLEKAIFCQPEVAFGLVPGGGAIERLTLLMGRGRALEMLLGSDDFDAATAERYGMINRALPDHELDGFVAEFIRRIRSFDREGLSTVKQLVNRHGLPNADDLIASTNAFRRATSLESTRKRLGQLAEGARTNPDFERRLGYHAGQLSR